MGSLVFFAFIIGIDLLFKSMKDKKKIEAIRQKKMQELKNKPINQSSNSVSSSIKREELKEQNRYIGDKKSDFHGEGQSYRDEHEGYRERYDDRYKSIQESYTKDIDDKNHSLYDPNAIETSSKKQYKELDIRDYGRDKNTVEIPVPKASTFKKDVLNGIIFAEILGKPKSLQKR
nr:hypothetical protein [Tissierella sp.]